MVEGPENVQKSLKIYSKAQLSLSKTQAIDTLSTTQRFTPETATLPLSTGLACAHIGTGPQREMEEKGGGAKNNCLGENTHGHRVPEILKTRKSPAILFCTNI